MEYSKEDLIWLAGFIDGEGCVSFIKRHKRPADSFRFEIRISNTDLMILSWIKERFGGYLYELKGRSKLGNKPCYQWWIADKKAKRLYEEMKPYLKIK